MGVCFIPSFIVNTPATKQSRLRAQQARLWRVKSSKFPLAMLRRWSPKTRLFIVAPSDGLPLLFLTHSLIHTQLACLLLHSSSHPPLPASSSSSSPPLSSARTHTRARSLPPLRSCANRHLRRLSAITDASPSRTASAVKRFVEPRGAYRGAAAHRERVRGPHERPPLRARL